MSGFDGIGRVLDCLGFAGKLGGATTPPTAYLACLGLRTIETLDECLQFDPDANETPGKKVFVSE